MGESEKIKELEESKESNTSGVRIGVFICNCGSNIGSIIDCKNLSEYSMSLPNVVFSQDNLYTCSETGLSNIKQGIKDNNLNRVIVAACTPRTHEPLFKETVSEMGLNPYFFEFVNIREQCSWVHQKQKEAANQKARDLIRMGVAKAALLKPLEKSKVKVNPSCLVIGGGIAGLTAALNLANQGISVSLIEKDKNLGGRLRHLNKLSPYFKSPEEVLKIVDVVENHPSIMVYKSAKIIDIEGFIGNFNIQFSSQGKEELLTVGTIIVAIGAHVWTPHNYYNYNGKNIITHEELEVLLKENKVHSKNIVMIQCVGSRIEERQYCSNICCMNALKNALIIKKRDPDTNIVILYRDIFAPGTKQEDYYREVRSSEVLFLRYDPDKPPVVQKDKVVVYNESLKEDIEMDYDLIVLSTPLVANDESKQLSQMLKVPLEENGFFLEAHVKLRPVEFATDGIFLCGCARWPSNVSDTISQANAAAAKASAILNKGEITVEGSTAFIDEEKCVGCQICMKICPYNAIMKDEEDKMIVKTVLCKGCGLCGATCPHEAITINHFTDDQIISQINALTGRESFGV